MKFILPVALFVFVVLPLAALIAGQAGLFRGTMPDDLGVRNGRLKPPSENPNSVSSQANLYSGPGAEYARIAPIRFRGDGTDALTKIGAYALVMPGARIMQSSPNYLYVQFQTRVLKFVDDCEFWLSPDEGVIHVRSAARLGRKDFGVNRARIESLRAAIEQAP